MINIKRADAEDTITAENREETRQKIGDLNVT